ncbi:response regulator [Brevibacillus brevis]|uniref:Response regulator n=1 Tax=Brevibacillus brevis TaxID=1393 RepID=A0ABY9T622_BREBE|nr:response regulator [Brevibacillus brevis]WNC15333.1 response regulator [Brevibacillus brevis]
MKVFIVDDEPLALLHLAEKLKRIGGVDIIGAYHDPLEALEMIAKDPPQAVFLDIQMPECNGLEVAEQISQQLPEVKIVFITAYDEYAVKAFDLNALDYLLKPIRQDRLLKTVERLVQSSQIPYPPLPYAQPGVVRCLRSLQFERSDKGLITLRWKTVKAQELFAFLLHHRGTPVKKQGIIDQLWPETDWKKGMTQLYTAIYQIRKNLSEEAIGIQIINCDDGYLLEMNGVGLDVEEWEGKLDRAPAIAHETLDWHLRLLQQYRGDYLADHHFLWAETEKIRLRAKYLQHAHGIARFLTESGKISEAVTHYLHVQKILPTEESIYFDLMRLYDQLEDRFSVEKQYELLMSMLHSEYDVKPHATVQEWFENWKRG